jgi:hypothetical protein
VRGCACRLHAAWRQAARRYAFWEVGKSVLAIQILAN